jgi:hypothetical protein
MGIYMSVIAIVAGLSALLVFPLIAYGVIRSMSRGGETERPEPPDPHESRRTIPGHDSDG